MPNDNNKLSIFTLVFLVIVVLTLIVLTDHMINASPIPPHNGVCIEETQDLCEVKKAIELFCEWKGTTAKALFEKRSVTLQDLSESILEVAQWHRIDPMVLVALSGRESLYDPKATHDQGRGCGILGIRHDFKNRPTCKQLLQVEYSLQWTAVWLAKSRDKNNGWIDLSRWNGKDYELRVWRDVDRLNREVRK